MSRTLAHILSFIMCEQYTILELSRKKARLFLQDLLCKFYNTGFFVLKVNFMKRFYEKLPWGSPFSANQVASNPNFFGNKGFFYT